MQSTCAFTISYALILPPNSNINTLLIRIYSISDVSQRPRLYVDGTAWSVLSLASYSSNPPGRKLSFLDPLVHLCSTKSSSGVLCLILLLVRFPVVGSSVAVDSRLCFLYFVPSQISRSGLSTKLCLSLTGILNSACEVGLQDCDYRYCIAQTPSSHICGLASQLLVPNELPFRKIWFIYIYSH